MKNKKLIQNLQQSLSKEVQPERLEETVKYCVEILKEQKNAEEDRTSFLKYLSDVFRFEGVTLFGLQAMVLLFVCVIISSFEDVPQYIPAFMPLFVAATMPAIFKSQFYGMNEIEAVTRASGAQIMLAKLILAAAANLVCITVVLFLEVYLQNSCSEIEQMVLYCLVPYLVCMTAMLRIVRSCRKNSMRMCAVELFSACVCWGMSSKVLPWLYGTSATGLWVIAFYVFTTFFIKEFYFIIKMRKEGKMYGIIY